MVCFSTQTQRPMVSNRLMVPSRLISECLNRWIDISSLATSYLPKFVFNTLHFFTSAWNASALMIPFSFKSINWIVSSRSLSAWDIYDNGNGTILFDQLFSFCVWESPINQTNFNMNHSHWPQMNLPPVQFLFYFIYFLF